MSVNNTNRTNNYDCFIIVQFAHFVLDCLLNCYRIFKTVSLQVSIRIAARIRHFIFENDLACQSGSQMCLKKLGSNNLLKLQKYWLYYLLYYKNVWQNKTHILNQGLKLVRSETKTFIFEKYTKPYFCFFAQNAGNKFDFLWKFKFYIISVNIFFFPPLHMYVWCLVWSMWENQVLGLRSQKYA